MLLHILVMDNLAVAVAVAAEVVVVEEDILLGEELHNLVAVDVVGDILLVGHLSNRQEECRRIVGGNLVHIHEGLEGRVLVVEGDIFARIVTLYIVKLVIIYLRLYFENEPSSSFFNFFSFFFFCFMS